MGCGSAYRGGAQKGGVGFVVGVEGGRRREALLLAPKRALVGAVLVNDARVLGVQQLQIHNLVAKRKVENVVRQLGGGGDRLAEGGARKRDDVAHLRGGFRRRALGHFVVKLGRVGERHFELLGQLDKEQLELVARPLDAVVGDLRKVAQRAHGHAVRVGGRAPLGVRARLERDNGVDVAIGAHGATLEQTLLVLDTLTVDVETRLHIVQRVAHAVEPHPKGIVEMVL